MFTPSAKYYIAILRRCGTLNEHYFNKTEVKNRNIISELNKILHLIKYGQIYSELINSFTGRVNDLINV